MRSVIRLSEILPLLDAGDSLHQTAAEAIRILAAPHEAAVKRALDNYLVDLPPADDPEGAPC